MSLALPSSNWRHVGRGRCHKLRSRHTSVITALHSTPFNPDSVDTTWESTSTEQSRASTPISEYVRSRNLTFASPAPEIACLCSIDLCTCERVRPDTPATPLYLELWDPTKSKDPIRGLHYDRK